MADDARSLPNTALLETSFLYGANATFVEEMAARYLDDPNSVDASWRAFFEQSRDDPEAVARRRARGRPGTAPSWRSRRPPKPPRCSDGNWAGLAAKLEQQVAARLPGASTQDVQSAARDSVRALMMIRAYRTRGHLAANLDPLGIEVAPAGARTRSRKPRLRPERSRSADLHRRRARPADRHRQRDARRS